MAVVGGGGIGLCCARSLARRGHDVVVVEQSICGSGASYGNAGWITPVLSGPVAAPGVVRQALTWLARSDSPLSITLRLDPDLALWLWRFWRSSSRRRYLAGLETMVALAERTFPLFDQLEQELRFEMHAGGLLFAVRNRGHLDEYRRVASDVARAGYSATTSVLDQSELARMEPALLPSVVGALHVAEERYIRPDDFTSKLASDLRSSRTEVLEGVAVERFLTRDGRIIGLGTSVGEVRAEAVVIAAGAWSAKLVRRLGFSLPLQNAKGYSVTGDPPPLPPRNALYLTEARVGVSPFEDTVRLAGTLELGSTDLRLEGRRIAALRRATALYLRPEALVWDGEAWAGMRPLLPDGLPAIGPVPAWNNVFLATGHGLLGITLAPATGELIADVVDSGRLPDRLLRLDPRRFASRRL